MVGLYAQWLVSNSGRKESLYVKTLSVKLKYRVYQLSAASSSTTKIMSHLKTEVAAAKKAVHQAESKVSALKK